MKTYLYRLRDGSMVVVEAGHRCGLEGEWTCLGQPCSGFSSEESWGGWRLERRESEKLVVERG